MEQIKASTIFELSDSAPPRPIVKFKSSPKFIKTCQSMMPKQILHECLGASFFSPSEAGLTYVDLDILRMKSAYLEGWKVKRLSVKVDNCIVDASIFLRPIYENTGRWVLISLGLGDFYERIFSSANIQNLLISLQANCLLFNYPGVGCSTGSPSRSGMIASYHAMLRYLEENIQAKEIIGYGHSLGASVQAEALLNFTLSNNIKYCFIKDRGFANLRTVVEHQMGSAVAQLIDILGWKFSSVESSLKLEAPELIIQTVDDEGKFIDDGQIPANATLGQALFPNDAGETNRKRLLKVTQKHNEPMTDLAPLVCEVNQLLKL